MTRIVDKVILKGFESPINIYTVDIDLDNKYQQMFLGIQTGRGGNEQYQNQINES